MNEIELTLGLSKAYLCFHKMLQKNPNNHDGEMTHLEPDILECEVKWALGSITTNKASGDDGTPVELFFF